MTSETTISVREFARRIHVSEGAVRRAIDEGKIKNGVSYIKKTIKGVDVDVPVINFSAAYTEYGQSKTSPKAGHGVSKQKAAEKMQALAGVNISLPAGDDEPGSNDDISELQNLSYTELLEQINVHPSLTYNEAIRRNEILAVAKEKMNLEEKQRKLVNKDEIDKQLFALGIELKQNLQNIPNRVISLIRSAPNEVEAANILLKEINQILESFNNNN